MKRTPLMAAAALAAAASLAVAGDLDGETIVRRADQMHRSKDESGVIEMVLVSADDRKQRRDLKMLFKAGEDGNDNHVLQFLSPPAVAGTALLTIEASERSDDQWIFLPALKKSKKIASADRSNRFAQTDFTYEDLRTEDFERNTYQRLQDGEVGGAAVYVVEAKPRQGASSGYSKRVLYVSKDRFLTHQIDYYDPKGRHQKTLRNLGFAQVSGLWRPNRAVMEDHQRGTKTLWRFSQREINPGLGDSLFTVASIERGL